MRVSKNRRYRSRAVLSLMFASGLLTASLSSVAGTKVTLRERAVQRIGSAAKVSVQGRSLNLLNFARSVLDGADLDQIVKDENLYEVEPTYLLQLNYNGNPYLDDWSESLVLQDGLRSALNTTSAPTTERLILADHATQLSVKLQKEAPESATKLHKYFIASLLFRRIGNTQGALECERLIEQSIEDCETNTDSSPEAIKQAVSVLNLMAFRLAPVTIPNAVNSSPSLSKHAGVAPVIDATAASKSERLRLRALDLADRLQSSDHVRRKAHRDMVFWYRHFDKQNLAEEQKQILFELVGVSDDKILFPVSQFCGRAIWWTAAAGQVAALCGMG